MSWAIVAVSAATVISGAMSADAAEDAGDVAARGAQAQLNEARRQFDIVREDTRLQRETGNDALRTLGFLLGVRQAPSAGRIRNLERQVAEQTALLESAQEDQSHLARVPGTRTGGRQLKQLANPARLTPIQERLEELKSELESARQDMRFARKYKGGLSKYVKSQPGYKLGLNEGMKGVTNALSASGQQYGGKAIKAAMRFGQDYASTKVDESMGRLLTLAGFGPVAANTSAGAGAGVTGAAGQYANTMGQVAYNNAAARTGAVNNALNTGISLWSYNNMNRTQTLPTGLTTTPQGSLPPNTGAYA